MKNIPLIEKYRAKNFEDIKGQDNAKVEVKTFFKTFPMKRALILSGPVGTGKTSLAIALANENNLELFELNASDLRDRASLERVLKPSIDQKSLFKKGKLILMDEAEGITTSDRGGLPELIFLIEKTSFPIIITANNIWDKKFSLLRQKSKIVSLKELNENSIIEIIKETLKKERKKLSDETINLIAKQSRGDARAALNDMQSILELGDEFIEFYKREKEESIFEILKKLFQQETDTDILRIFDNSNLGLDEILLWIEENLDSEYKGTALSKAFDSLSRADIFRGRVYRQQYWRFLVYQNFFLSAGISAASKLKNKKFINYKRPSRILKIWLTNKKNEKIKLIIGKYAKFCHISRKKAMKDKFLLPFILDNLDEKTKKRLDLNNKEQDFLIEKKNELLGQLNKKFLINS